MQEKGSDRARLIRDSWMHAGWPSLNQKRFRPVGLHMPPGYKRPGAARALMPRPAVTPHPVPDLGVCTAMKGTSEFVIRVRPTPLASLFPGKVDDQAVF